MKNGIAFSGGGLKIFAHIGVLKALEELGIEFDYVSGTSSGSVIAAFYALGIKPNDMFKIISSRYKEIAKINVRNVFGSAIKSIAKNELKLKSLINGSKIENAMQNMLIDEKITKTNMKDLDKKLAIVSCDTISTKEVIFLSEDFNIENTERTDYIIGAEISKAIRASMSFPGVLTPCDFEKYNLIDGGTVNNLPTKVLKEMGAEKVLGVCFELNPYEPEDDILSVALRAADIFSILNMSVAKEYLNLLLELSIPDTGLLDIKDVNHVIDLGYNETMAQKELILREFKNY